MRHHACVTGGWSVAARVAVAIAVAGVSLAAAERGYALTEGPLPPASVVDDSSFGGNSWFLPGNAIASDNTYAQVAPSGLATHYLKATTFGFNIPLPAEILGIEVLVERKSAAGSIVDARARLVKGGVVGTTDRSLAPPWSPTETTVTYGSPSDLWGTTWTPSDINNAGFGFALSVNDGVDAAAVDQIQIRVTYSLCAAAPTLGCRTAGKSVLVISNNATDAKDKLVWKWIKGQNTTQADFGDEVMGTANIALCVYDNGALAGSALVAPGAGWSTISTKGWKFLDKSGAQDGVQKIILKASTSGKSKALVKGKGAGLPDMATPFTGPVTVQLVNSETGLCWTSAFSAPFSKNVATKFKDKAP